MWKQWTQEKEKSVMFTHDIGGIHESSNKQDEPGVTDHEHERAAKGYSWGDREVEHGLPPSFTLVSSTFSVTSWGV